MEHKREIDRKQVKTKSVQKKIANAHLQFVFKIYIIFVAKCVCVSVCVWTQSVAHVTEIFHS